LPWPDTILLAGAASEADRVEWLSEEERAALSALHRPGRRQEWALSRIAMKQLAVESGFAADPRSCAVGVGTISIGGLQHYASLSHSEHYAGAIVGNAPVGIDVQTIRPLPERAAHLFLTGDEKEVMERCSIEQRILHFWCAKEAAWKQQLGAVATLTQIPLTLEGESSEGLLFDGAETRRVGDVIVAISRRTL
jgi:phosphopantetheinyl transferase